MEAEGAAGDGPGPFSDGDSVLSGTGDQRLSSGLANSNGVPLPPKKQQSGTVNSQASIWSVGSSVASFDYHTVSPVNNNSSGMTASGGARQLHQEQQSLTKSKERPNNSRSSNNSSSSKKCLSTSTADLTTAVDPSTEAAPAGIRIPPEGAPASDPSPRASFVQRIEVRADLQRRSEAIATEKKPPRHQLQQQQQRKTGKEAAREEVADLLQPQEDSGDDELIMLKRLISEGRISGLNDKPPAFKPPTPPSKTASAAKKQKAPAPKTPDVNKAAGGRQTAAKGPGSEDRPRKAREAPPPPPASSSSHPIKAQPETSEIKFLSGRRIHSVEDLVKGEDVVDGGRKRTDREGRREERTEAVQRSTSMHLTRGGQD